MKNILVLCTGNSCRSQMAHGYLTHFTNSNDVAVYSAGVESHGVNALAVAIMREDGVDISKHTSNLAEEYSNIPFDFVITVCDNAKERCPFFPTQAIKWHHNFPDPSKAKGSTMEVIESFRTVRQQIKAYCKDFVETHNL
ncbi:arsenate reductase ArsC [Flavobacterium buctense]|uniref:Arsenate reductase ArsC n=1 Tax=Flavobacterium buctense TaxID=1648146 RepID=A0ABU9E4G2_9FLAO|nr:arsenate reductase ArsC [Flavobacterium buctense]